ncbi:MAG: hypothetical protein RIE86_10185 [Imperialibacter sp.]|uniref:hypothetical protein n=1 Tax=Imperialibacter sp. TaxID=2038411 RepID=UPI0032EDDD7E
MVLSEIDSIERQLKIKLPDYYVKTMLDYPFPADSFAAELSLCTNVKSILDNNCVFQPAERSFAVGSDGGEFIYYVKLDGEEKVYIYDFERSHVHNSVEADTWAGFLHSLSLQEEELNKDELLEEKRKRNKKWWQFWI